MAYRKAGNGKAYPHLLQSLFQILEANDSDAVPLKQCILVRHLIASLGVNVCMLADMPMGACILSLFKVWVCVCMCVCVRVHVRSHLYSR